MKVLPSVSSVETSGKYRVRRLLDPLARALVHLLCRVEIKGLHNIPPEGPVILLANHINFADVSILIALMPRRPVGMAKEEVVRNWLLGPFLRLYGTIPIRRGEVDRQALRRALDVLAEGEHIMMIAPEGHRSGDGRLQKARDGVAFIAIRSNAVVVPVAVMGVEHFWRRMVRFRRTMVRIVVGEGFRFKNPGGKPTRDQLREMTAEAMYRLASLLLPEYRGVYSDLGQAGTRHLDFDVGPQRTAHVVSREASPEEHMTV